jgi:hypothetical protein
MFYFQHLLQQGLGGIDNTAILAGITGVAYSILLVSFLLAIYQAAMRSGDLQSLAVAAVRYLVVAVILANWSALFREVTSSFDQVSGFIAGASGAGDTFLSWMNQLSAHFTSDGFSALLPALSGGLAAIVTALLILAAYLIYALMVAIFAFFYVLYGCILYVLGPLVLALLPAMGLNQLARSYALNLLVWNAWSLLYGIFAALITAIQLDRIDQVINQGFVAGLFVGLSDSLLLGLVSVFYALALALIPFIARRILSGEVGSSAWALVRAGAAAVADVRSALAGFEAGSHAGSISGSAGSGAETGSAVPGAAASFSSSMPPPVAGLGDAIRADIRSAVEGSVAPPAPLISEAVREGGSRRSALASHSAPAQTNSPRPGASAGQLVAFQAGKLAAVAVRGEG